MADTQDETQVTGSGATGGIGGGLGTRDQSDLGAGTKGTGD